jgi:DNA-binding GntR family transcriptional regulator
MRVMASTEPAYKTVAAALRADIASGSYPPTRRLPTDAELGESFGVSRQTVRHAFAQLVAEGLVYRVRRRGSFAVASPPGAQYLRSLGSIEDLLALSMDTELEVVTPLAETVDVAAAGRLRLESDMVSTGVYRRLHAGQPFGAMTFYLPPDVGAAVAGDPRLSRPGARSAATIIQLIEEARGIPITGCFQSISATPLGDADADLLDAEPGEAALAVDRLYVDARGDLVELASSLFNVRRYSYRLQLRRSLV